MKKIHVVSELYYPEQNATGYFLTGIAEGLAAEGWETRVIAAQPSYNQRGTKAPWTEKRKGVDVRRCRSTTFDPTKIVGRTLNFVTISLSLAWNATLSVRKNDAVLVVTNPPLLPFLIRGVCALKRARFLLLVHDVYPDVFVPLGLLNRGHPLYRVIDWMNGRLYASAERVIALGRDMSQLIEHKSNKRARCVIIPNWGDVDQIRPEERAHNALLMAHGLADKFIVHYSGNHGRTHDFETILKAAKILREEPNIHFLFIGAGSGKAEAVKFAESLELENVTFLPFVDRAELNSSLNASDVSLISFKSGMEGISVPSRLYNLLASGRPIIAVVDEKSEVALVLSEAGAGIAVAPGAERDLASSIIELKRDDVLRREMGERAREAALKNYSYDAVRAKFRGLFAEIGWRSNNEIGKEDNER